MENEQIPPASDALDNYFNISFDTTIRAQIRQAAIWAKVYALCAFIGYGIALIVAFFGRVIPFSSSLGIDDNPAFSEAMSSFRTSRIIAAVLTAAVGVFINYFLYRFSVSTVNGIDAMDNVTTNQGFGHLRRYFRILGIILIIVLSFMVLAFFFGIMSGLSRL